MERVKPKRDDGIVTLDALEQALRINENALDEALMQQPDAFYRVSKAVALLTSRRDAAKQRVAEIEAETTISVRATAAKHSDKITAGEVSAEVARDSDVIKAVHEHLALSGMVMQYVALKDAFSQRSYVLKDLVSLHAIGYFGDVTGRKSRNEAKDRAADDNRRGMAEMRKGVK